MRLGNKQERCASNDKEASTGNKKRRDNKHGKCTQGLGNAQKTWREK